MDRLQQIRQGAHEGHVIEITRDMFYRLVCFRLRHHFAIARLHAMHGVGDQTCSEANRFEAMIRIILIADLQAVRLPSVYRKQSLPVCPASTIISPQRQLDFPKDVADSFTPFHG